MGPLAPLIDIGINLTHDSYDADRAQVLARAAAAGVVQLVVTGASAASSRHAAELAGSHPQRLYATAGVHPHHAAELDARALGELAALSLEPGVVAIGECGLDYYRDFCPRPVQRAGFVRQLELAIQLRRPVFLHQRDAHEDFLAILCEHASGLVGGVAHCFTGSVDQAQAYLEQGLHIGITGWICDERRGRHLHEVVRAIPPGRLLLETDGPYLLPRDLPAGAAMRRNEPCYLPHIARVIAASRGETPQALATHTTRAARALFALHADT